MENPCVICENYMKGKMCERKEICPVGIMKKKYKELRKELQEVKEDRDKLRSEADWDWELRTHIRDGFI